MDELIISILQGGRASDDEKASLREWRRQSPANEQRFRDLSALWSVTAAAAPEWMPVEPPSVELLVARAGSESAPAANNTDMLDLRQRRNAFPAKRSPGLRLRVGALAAACAAVGFGLAHIADRGTPEGGILAHSEIRTGAGEMTTITLGDGSSIRLGARSSVRIHMEGETRVAHLDGRAFFGVQSDRSARFVVRTQFGEAVVLGTRFEVRSEDQEFRVLVVEGRVQVRVGDSEAELEPGQMSRSPAGGPPTTTRVADVYAQLDWMAGALVFQETSVVDAVREIEHRYGVAIDITDEQLTRMSVSVTFTDQPLEAVMQVLSEILNARWTRTGNQIVMSRRDTLSSNRTR